MEHMQTHIKQLKSFKTRVIKLEKQRAPQVYSEVRQIAEYIHIINDDIAYYNNRQNVQHLHVQEEKLKSNPVPRRSSQLTIQSALRSLLTNENETSIGVKRGHDDVLLVDQHDAEEHDGLAPDDYDAEEQVQDQGGDDEGDVKEYYI